MLSLTTMQVAVAAIYLFAAAMLYVDLRYGWRKTGVAAITVSLIGCVIHLLILLQRWMEYGQLPIVTRYENISVDSLAVAGVFLLAQWRNTGLRSSGIFVLPVAAAGMIAALWYNPSSIPWSPALRTNWLVIHATLNSLAVGAGTLAAAAIVVPSAIPSEQKGRILGWTFLLWCAMIAAGSYWASMSWGRFWGWDPIESWALATALVYAFVLHLRLRPKWQNSNNRALFGIFPYMMMMFTTYGLLVVRSSAHSRYMFQ